MVTHYIRLDLIVNPIIIFILFEIMPYVFELHRYLEINRIELKIKQLHTSTPPNC